MRLGKADLHLHTDRTDGFFPPEEVVLRAAEKGLDVIAVTDHDLIKPAYEAREFALKKKLPIEVVIGEEVTTNEGEVIGLYIKKRVRPLENIFKVAENIKRQGGLVIMPHPGRLLLGFGSSLKTIEKLFQNNLVDGIEIYNFWDYGFRLASKRKAKNRQWQLANIGASDSHHIKTIGRIWTEFPGKTSLDLRKAIERGKTIPKREFLFLIKRVEEIRHLLIRARRSNNRIAQVNFWKKLAHMLK